MRKTNNDIIHGMADRIQQLTAENEVLRKVIDGLIEAWEKLDEGDYSPRVIEVWLNMDMKSAFNKARQAIKIGA